MHLSSRRKHDHNEHWKNCAEISKAVWRPDIFFLREQSRRESYIHERHKLIRLRNACFKDRSGKPGGARVLMITPNTVSRNIYGHRKELRRDWMWNTFKVIMNNTWLISGMKESFFTTTCIFLSFQRMLPMKHVCCDYVCIHEVLTFRTIHIELPLQTS